LKFREGGKLRRELGSLLGRRVGGGKFGKKNLGEDLGVQQVFSLRSTSASTTKGRGGDQEVRRGSDVGPISLEFPLRGYWTQIRKDTKGRNS